MSNFLHDKDNNNDSTKAIVIPQVFSENSWAKKGKKKIQDQPVQLAQAELSLNFLLLVYFLFSRDKCM